MNDDTTERIARLGRVHAEDHHVIRPILRRLLRRGTMADASQQQRYVAIVGHAADKFTEATEDRAREAIHQIMGKLYCDSYLVSGGCHQGGVDIFAEEVADRLGMEKIIFLPKDLQWSTGFKPRNIQIAERCTEAHCIVVAEYPPGYEGDNKGLKFPECYHCGKDRPHHVKSGGCWTVKRAQSLGKPATWHIV